MRIHTRISMLITLLALFASCGTPSSYDCAIYDVGDIKSRAIIFDKDEFSAVDFWYQGLDHEGSSLVELPLTDSVLQITTVIQPTLERQIKSAYSSRLLRLSFFNEAQALSPCETEFNTDIESIRITSNRDFDNQHLAGENLNDLFHLSIGESLNFIVWKLHLWEVEDYLDDAGADSHVRNGVIMYYLKKLPTEAVTHSFTIEYTFLDGTVLETTTEPINLTGDLSFESN